MSTRVFLAIINFVLLVCTNPTCGASDSSQDASQHSQLHANAQTHRRSRRLHQTQPSPLPTAPNPKIPPTVSHSSVATYGQWPFMVSISHNSGGGYNKHMCGGTLISKSLVLTAAHCVYSNKRLIPLSGYTLHVGINDLQNDESLGNAYEVRKVTKVIPHPNYKAYLFCRQGGACDAFDMALLVLDRQVTTIKPIALPKSKKMNFTNKSFYVLGWGSYNSKGDFSKILRYAQVPYIPRSTCNVLSKKFNLLDVPSTHVCAGDSTNLADTCVGDSGGPMILKKATGGYIQVGVTSYGAPETCGYTYYQTSQTRGKRKKEKKGIFGVYSSTAVLNSFLKTNAKKVVAPV